MAETGRGPVSASPSWSWWPVVPAALAALVAAVLQLAGPRVSLVFALRPAFLVLLVGVVASATWVVLARVRTHAATRRRAELEAAVARTRSDARDDHRRFLSRLDHELKNPVTAIRAALAAHGSGGADHLRTADEQATRLAAVVTDLRKLAELQTSELEVEPVDLTALVEEAVTALRGEISVLGERRDVRVQFPEAPWQVPTITGDPDLLYLAVHNVLANARKFTADGDLIEVRAAEADGFVEIDVADTGRGIPDAELGGVWDELSRASNARTVPGSGLGMTMVRTVVERHGGSVAIRSRLGAGTGVRMRLPVGR